LLFAEHAQSDRPAIIDLRDPKRPRSVSFKELDAGCDAVARGLTRDGLKPGDRIGILSLNRAEFVVTLLGAMRAGVVPVPVNAKLPADAVAHVLNDAGARFVFVERELKRLASAGLHIVEYASGFSIPARSRHSSLRRTPSQYSPIPRARPAVPKACCSRTTARTGAGAFSRTRAARRRRM
jgi:long-subunit acyl-CoA synthetase (AMP-forming)